MPLRRTRRKPGDPPPPHYVIDRRMPDGPCWIIDKQVNLSTQANRWLTETVGKRGPGQCFQHLCEIASEPNRCIRPEHVVIGTKATNTQHMHDLRRTTGVPWTGGRRSGEKMAPYQSEPWTCWCGWSGTRHGAALHRFKAHGESGSVPPTVG